MGVRGVRLTLPPPPPNRPHKDITVLQIDILLWQCKSMIKRKANFAWKERGSSSAVQSMKLPCMRGLSNDRKWWQKFTLYASRSFSTAVQILYMCGMPLDETKPFSVQSWLQAWHDWRFGSIYCHSIDKQYIGQRIVCGVFECVQTVIMQVYHVSMIRCHARLKFLPHPQNYQMNHPWL